MQRSTPSPSHDSDDETLADLIRAQQNDPHTSITSFSSSLQAISLGSTNRSSSQLPFHFSHPLSYRSTLSSSSAHSSLYDPSEVKDAKEEDVGHSSVEYDENEYLDAEDEEDEYEDAEQEQEQEQDGDHEEYFIDLELTEEQILSLHKKNILAQDFDFCVADLYAHHAKNASEFYSVDYYELINELHYENSKLIENRFVALTRSLAYLAKTLKEHEGLFLPVAQSFFDNATQLTLEIASRHVAAKRSRSRNFYLHNYEYQLAALKRTVDDATVFLKNPSELKNQQAFNASIINLQNHYQSPVERFFWERPFLSGLISSGLMLLGAGLTLLGVLVTPLNPLASVFLMTAGIVIFSLGACIPVSFLSVQLLINKDDEVFLLRQVSITAKEARTLIKSPNTLFSSVNTSMETHLQVEVDASIDETERYSPTSAMV